MKGVVIIVFVTTFTLFLAEAFIHYNIGHKTKKLVWPSGKEVILIMGTVALFSLINSVFVWGLEKIFPKE